MLINKRKMKKTKKEEKVTPVKKPLFTEQELIEANTETKKIANFMSKDFILRIIERESKLRGMMRHFNIDDDGLDKIMGNYKVDMAKIKKAILGVDYIPLKPKLKKETHTTKYEKGTGNIVHTYKGVKFYEFLSGNYRQKNGLKSVYEVKGDNKQFNSIEDIKEHILSNYMF